MSAKKERREIVELAGREFIVKRIPMARVKRIESVITETVSSVRQDIDIKEAAKNPESAVGNILDKVLEFPHAILSLFIDDLPKDIFLDEENGVDFPDFLDALKVALTLNRVDILKNVFSRLMTTMVEAQKAQASISRKTS